MLPAYLREFSIITSAAEAMKMSMSDVEEKFTLSQLIIMSTIQNIQFEHEKNKHPGSKRVLNKTIDPKEQNRRAWRYL